MAGVAKLAREKAKKVSLHNRHARTVVYLHH